MSPKTMKKMKHAVAWFEIPATKLERAKKFYESILDIEMTYMNMDEFKMPMFPVEEGGVGGALCENDEYYKPGHEGSLIYISANPDLQTVLDRVESSGGKILQEKTKITDEYGYMALFEDSEGNRIGLHSMR